MPRIEWSKLRAPLPWQHQVVNGSLVIPRAAQQDSGQYICNASSPLGYTEVFVTLDVESKGTAGSWGTPGFLLPSPLWPSPILPLYMVTSIATSTLTSSPSSWDPPCSIAALILLVSSSSQAPSPTLPVDVSTCLSHPCACPSPLLLSHPSQLKPISLSLLISLLLSLPHGSIHLIHPSTHLSLYLLTLTFLYFLWIHPLPIHHSSHPSLHLCSHLSVCLFLVDSSIQHTPISPSPYSSIHFVLVNSSVSHPS